MTFKRFGFLCLFFFYLNLSFVYASESFNSATLLSIKGAIGPATADYISDGFEHALNFDSDFIILTLDTPGGLDRSMRDIIQMILASDIPVISYVFPSGSRAASAGTYILYASHIAAMSPGTNLGASTPVTIAPTPDLPDSSPNLPSQNDSTASIEIVVDSKMRKAVNDAKAYIKSLAQLRDRNYEWAVESVEKGASLSAQDALDIGVINFVVEDIDELLASIHMQNVVVDNNVIQLVSNNTQVIPFKPSLKQRVLQIISSPDLAYMLLIAGAYGLFLEFSNPGIMIAGIFGSMSILIALYALHLFPIQYTGLTLIILGLGFFIGEFITPTFGMMTIGGTIAFILGSFFLIDSSSGFPGISLHLILVFSFLNILLIGFISRILYRAFRKPTVSGSESLVGKEATVVNVEQDYIQVSINGELWHAKCNVQLQKSSKVKVIQVDNLLLIVELISS